MKYTKNEILEAFTEARSRSDVCRILNFAINGSGLRKVNKWIKEYNINIAHFVSGSEKCRKYPIVEKECPVCKNIFLARQGSPKEKQTCSYGCSNTLFRSGKKNGRWLHGQCYRIKNYCVKDPEYRIICFQHYEKKCVICGWDKSVDVHHIDGDNKNNDPKNLIPLCANHHRLTVMNEYKEEINSQICEIVKKKFG